MAFKRAPLCYYSNLGSTSIISGRSPPLYCCTLTLIAMQGHQKNSEDKIVHHQNGSNCERSELLICQVHQFELGCIKLHTPYRFKIHPKLYSDWSMCIVFLCVEFLNTFLHRVESTVVFRSSFNIMARRTKDAGVEDAGVEECKGYSPPNDHTTSASPTPLPLGSWNLNTCTRSRSTRKRNG